MFAKIVNQLPMILVTKNEKDANYLCNLINTIGDSSALDGEQGLEIDVKSEGEKLTVTAGDFQRLLKVLNTNQEILSNEVYTNKRIVSSPQSNVSSSKPHIDFFAQEKKENVPPSAPSSYNIPTSVY